MARIAKALQCVVALVVPWSVRPWTTTTPLSSYRGNLLSPTRQKTIVKRYVAEEAYAVSRKKYTVYTNPSSPRLSSSPPPVIDNRQMKPRQQPTPRPAEPPRTYTAADAAAAAPLLAVGALLAWRARVTREKEDLPETALAAASVAAPVVAPPPKPASTPPKPPSTPPPPKLKPVALSSAAPKAKSVVSLSSAISKTPMLINTEKTVAAESAALKAAAVAPPPPADLPAEKKTNDDSPLNKKNAIKVALGLASVALLAATGRALF